MRKFWLCLALCVVVLLSGCCWARQYESRDRNDKLMELRVGMDRNEVISLLGKPYKREMYGNSEYLIYETNYSSNKENERFTPVLIQDGKVAGWGRNFYDDTKKSKIDADIRIKSQ